MIKIIRSPSILAAAVFSLGGVGFAAGYIMLARTLPVQQFGFVALFLAIAQIGMTLGPFGLELSINRHRLPVSGRLLGRAFFTGSIAALILAAVARFFYNFDLALTWTLAGTVVAMTVNQIVSTYFQSRERFGLSMFLGQIHTWMLLLAVPLLLVLGSSSALPVALLTMSGYVLMTLIGWSQRRRGREKSVAALPLPRGVLMKEGSAAIGINLASALLYQFDRLIIPSALSIGDLAIYAVVAAVVGSPFRMLQTGVCYTLLPRLRRAENLSRVNRLIRQESVLMLAMTSLAAVTVLTIGPWLVDVLIPGDYNPPQSVFVAVVVVGFVRVWCGLAQSVITALGTPRQLFVLNVWVWLGIAEGVIAACLVRSMGLTGIVYGLGSGWLMFGLAASILAFRSLREWRPAAERGVRNFTAARA